MSYRNNQDRVGAAPPSQDLVAQEQIREEGFSYAIPTEVVDLPSNGECYPAEHPLYGVGSIEIKHMTAKEEDILTSQALLKKGIALDRLLKSIILDKSINPDDLLVGDKNALIIAARINAYGSDYHAAVTCPACQAPSNTQFDLEALTNKVVTEEELMYSDAFVEDQRYFVKLPKSGATIGLHLLCGKDEKKMAVLTERKKKMRLPESALTDQLKMIIESVDGDFDRSVVSNFVDAMPAADSRHLRYAYSTLSPDVDLRQPFDCESCGYAQEVEIPLTADFFWPR